MLAGLDGVPGDAHDWDDGGAHAYQGHDCLDAARGDAHERDDADAQGDQGLQKHWMVRAQQPILYGPGADTERFPGRACSDDGRFPGCWFGGPLRRRLSSHIKQNTELGFHASRLQGVLTEITHHRDPECPMTRRTHVSACLLPSAID